jgi:hypothetical protein
MKIRGKELNSEDIPRKIRKSFGNMQGADKVGRFLGRQNTGEGRVVPSAIDK